ncbi:structural maintenance of chromosomes protein 5 [Enteropsectra breve]|nr:structural maintenance of chromosomes protein 5 [Enteropsectra breve]
MQYKNGNIVALHLENFQIFSNQRLEFQPSLNLITAPNGSGKSTLANALAFVLCGTPRIIGKSKDITDFIKFGTKEAKITAEIFYEGQIRRFSRVIKDITPSLHSCGIAVSNNDNNSNNSNKDNSNNKNIDNSNNSKSNNIDSAMKKKSKSLYFIDGNLASMDNYLTLIKAIGININSLCTLLPQERVSEFCAMEPPELLDEVLQASDVDFERMYRLQDELKECDTAMEQKQTRAGFIETTIANMENEMEQVRERDTAEERLVHLEYLKDSREYKKVYGEYLGHRKSIRELESLLSTKNEEIAAINAQIKAIESDDKIQSYNTSRKLLSEQNRDLERLFSVLREKNLKIGIKHMEIEGINKQKEKREEERERLVNEKNKIEEHMKTAETKLKDSIKSMIAKINEHRGDSKPLSYTSLISNINNINSNNASNNNANTNANNNINSNASNTSNNNSNKGFIISRYKNAIDSISSNLPVMHDLKNKMNAVNDRISQIRFLAKKQQFEIENAEREVLAYTEQKNMRMELLKRYHRDTHRGVEWLRSNEKSREVLFHGTVIEPAFLHLSIVPEYTAEIETLLSFQLLSSFLVTDSRDFLLLAKALKENLNLKINIAEIHANTKENRSNTPDFVGQMKSEMGIAVDGMAIDFIDAPPEYKAFYKNFINVYAHFDCIPVAKKELNERAIFKQYREIKRMVVDGRYVEIKNSRYSSDFVINTSGITSKGLFKANKIEVEKIRARLEELKAEREANRAESDTAMAEYTNIKELLAEKSRMFDMAELNKDFYMFKELGKRSDEYSRDFDESKREDFDGLIRGKAQEINAFKNEILRMHGDICAVLSIELVPEFSLEKIHELRLDLENMNRQHHILRVVIDESAALLEDKKRRKEESQKRSQDLKKDLRKYEIVAGINDNHDINNIDNMNENMNENPDINNIDDNMNDNDINNDVKNTNINANIMNKKFKLNIHEKNKPVFICRRVYDSLKDLNDWEVMEEMRQARAKLQRLGSVLKVKNEYEDRERQLLNINASIEEIQEQRNAVEQEYERVVLKNKKIAEGVIEPVSRNFRGMMERLNFGGELSLGTYDKRWGLDINVKFREEESLQRLSGTRHSGGEKSLSTILFLLSLQQVQRAAFRLVDEINQGMDAVNEKMVYEILKEMGVSTQMFIITPKLVEDVEFGEKTNAIVIYGGTGDYRKIESYMRDIK